MKRPKIVLQKSTFDKSIELISFGLVLLSIAHLGMEYAHLPETIPTHFDMNGQPDGYGKKTTLIILPILSALLFVVLFTANKYPHTMNFPVKITEKNAAFQYENATRMIRIIMFFIVAIFYSIIYKSIQIANGKAFGLGAWFIPIFLIVLFGTIAYYLSKSMKKRHD